MQLSTFLSAILLILTSVACIAEVRLPDVLSDHAVFQQEKPVRIWGWAAPMEKVHVAFHEQRVDSAADAKGTWQTWLKPEKAGGPYMLRVSGSATSKGLERTDILIGEVWLASGQSNMEFPVSGWEIHGGPLLDSDEVVRTADDPKIRFLVQPHRASSFPMLLGEGVWEVLTPDTVKRFSAIAYLFAQRISKAHGVAVGIIQAPFSGTPVHSWISAEGISWSRLASVQEDSADAEREVSVAEALKVKYAEDDANAMANHQAPPVHPLLVDRPEWIASALYNGMIAPYVNYSLRGVIWYQGESDSDTPNRGLHYAQAFSAMIEDWRRQWSEGPMPFLFVQISSFAGGEYWSTIRDAQRRSLDLVNTGMAVTIDVGSPSNIHPRDKQTVASRLAQTALGTVYGENVQTSSPLFIQATSENTSMRAWFSHAESLHSSEKNVDGFEVAGADHKFVVANARVELVAGQETIVASAASVAAPVYIRYAWTPVVSSYLYNEAGLPMGTFTSESEVQLMMR